MKGFLFDVLGALGREEHFPLSVIPHLALFISGNKKACRLILGHSVVDALVQISTRYGFNCANTAVKTVNVGSHWNSFVVDEIAQESAHKSKLFTISHERCVAEELLSLELSGEAKTVGQILGYPDCCIESYEETAGFGSSWYLNLISKTGIPRVSPWCNRLASLWGGTCPTGELFPCSLTCQKAIHMGKQAHQSLSGQGFNLLADEILRQARQPIALTEGEIVKWRPSISTKYQEIEMYE